MSVFRPLLDPVLVKELGGMSRRTRTYFGRFFFVVLTAAILYGVTAPVLERGGNLSTSEYALVGRKLFTAFTWLQMFFLPLAAAVSASDVVHREARMGTLQILMTTPLSPGRIVFGKWKAVMVQTAALALCGVPVLAISVYLGGVGAEDLAWSLCLSLVLAGVAGAVAIYYSIADRTVVEAAIRAYLVVQLSAIPFGVLWGIFAFARSDLYGIAAWTHPYCAWAAAADPARSGEIISRGWIGATVTTAGVLALYLRSATGHLRGSDKTGKFLDPSAARPRPAEQGFAKVEPGPVWDRWPLLWKEYSTRIVRLPTRSKVALGIPLAILTLIGVAGGWAGALVQLAVVCPMALVLMLAVGSAHFAREKERRGFEMLLSTPLRASHVVGTKLLAGILGPETIGLLVIIAIGFAGLLQGKAPRTTPVTVGVFMAFCYILATAASLRAKSHRSAFMVSAGIALFLLVGIPVVMGLLLGSAVGESPALLFTSHALHPLRAVLAEDDVPGREWLVPAYFAAYALASALLVGDMLFRYRRLAGGN